MPDGYQSWIGGSITDDGRGGSLRGLCLDGAYGGSVSHVAALRGGGTLGRHYDGLLMTRRVLLGRRRFASLLRAASVGRHVRWSDGYFRRVRHHCATMSGGFASHQRSTKHADDRDDHPNGNELANVLHAIAKTIINVEWTDDGDVGHTKSISVDDGGYPLPLPICKILKTKRRREEFPLKSSCRRS